MRYHHDRFAFLLCSALACASLTGCGERSDVATGTKPAVPAPAATPASHAPPTATLADGIVFSKPVYPDFVAKTEGIAQPEAFGRWTDGAKASIEFKQPLPKTFDLVVEGAAFGPNVGQPIKVTIGAVTQELTFPTELSKGAQVRRLSYSLDQPANKVDFLIPRPTRPPSSDIRELGIALVSLKIEAAR